MKPLHYFVGLLSAGGVVSFLLAVPAQATTWDLTSDFSLVANPNGVWAYGEFTPGFSIDSNTFTASPNSGWTSGSTDISIFNGGPGYGVAQGQISLHADSGTPDARWTAPFAGNFNISAIFGGPANVGGPGTGNADAHLAGLKIDGVSQSGTFDSGANTMTFNLSNIPLQGGDIVDAFVGQGFGSGNTQTFFTVTGTPEPAAGVLFALGLAGLCGRRRRTHT